MNSLQSALDSLITTGSVYGWRLDAMLLSAMIWVVLAGHEHLWTSFRMRPLVIRA